MCRALSVHNIFVTSISPFALNRLCLFSSHFITKYVQIESFDVRSGVHFLFIHFFFALSTTFANQLSLTWLKWTWSTEYKSIVVHLKCKHIAWKYKLNDVHVISNCFAMCSGGLIENRLISACVCVQSIN